MMKSMKKSMLQGGVEPLIPGLGGRSSTTELNENFEILAKNEPCLSFILAKNVTKRICCSGACSTAL